MRNSAVFLLAMIVAGCDRRPPMFDYDAGDFSSLVPLIRVVAFPDAYDGKRIFVSGFLNIEHEGNAIYFDKEHYLQGLTKNAISVAFPPELKDHVAKYHHQYVTVFGTFHVRPGGQGGFRGIYSGEIYIESIKDIWGSSRKDVSETGAKAGRSSSTQEAWK